MKKMLVSVALVAVGECDGSGCPAGELQGKKRSKSNGNEKFIPHGVIPFGIICGKGE